MFKRFCHLHELQELVSKAHIYDVEFNSLCLAHPSALPVFQSN